MNTLSSQPYKGARDYYPEDKRVQNYIFSVWKKVSESFGYEEYGAPVLEPLEVYTAKSGQELAGEQTYAFTDRGDRVVAIRPEMTPSICRMVAARRQEMAYPARLYSIANFMRYERPQRGREREFWQLNVDIFGYEGINAEAEILTMADAVMKEFGAKSSDYVIRVNNRELINCVMHQYLGLDAEQAVQMIKLFDRINKITKEEFTNQATEIFGVWAEAGLKKVEDLLKIQDIDSLPDVIRENSACEDLRELFEIVKHAGVKSIIFDVTLMRGLDYYTGTVFEVFDTNPLNARALFGGGRYDGLVGMFGVEPISAVGFAPGGTMMENFLATHDLLPKLTSNTDVYLVAVGDDVNNDVIKLASELRENGVNVETDLTDRKFDKKIKTAVKKQIQYIIFVGEEEVKTGKYSVKDIINSEEHHLNLNNIVSLIKKFAVQRKGEI